MMDPDSGRMTPLDAEWIEREMKANAEHEQATLARLFPGQVLWREGEEIEVRGCWFRVDAVRRTRVTLTPIPRPAR